MKKKNGSIPVIWDTASDKGIYEKKAASLKKRSPGMATTTEAVNIR
jgi:hypothetical protein